MFPINESEICSYKHLRHMMSAMHIDTNQLIQDFMAQMSHYKSNTFWQTISATWAKSNYKFVRVVSVNVY